MKELKERMQTITLSDEKKQRILQNIRQSAVPVRKNNVKRVAALTASAAALVFVALAAVVLSNLPHHSDMIAHQSNNLPLPSHPGNVSPVPVFSEISTDTAPSSDHTAQTSMPSNAQPAIPSSVSSSSIEEPSVPAQTSIQQPSIPIELSTDTPTVQPPMSESHTPSQEEPRPSISAPPDTSTPTPSTLTEPSTPSIEPPDTSVPSVIVSQPEPVVWQGKETPVTVPNEIPMNEYAGDLYRPDGFLDNIASGLALKLTYTPDHHQTYTVIVEGRRGVTLSDPAELADLLTKANRSLTEAPLHAKDFTRLYVNDVAPDHPNLERSFYEQFLARCCCAELTERQIMVLAECDVLLCYVGSGEGSVTDMNWNTPEGINTFCELIGDQWAFRNGELHYAPDLMAVSSVSVTEDATPSLHTDENAAASPTGTP